MPRKKQTIATPPERTHPIPLGRYHEVVQQHFGWKPTDYELQECWPNGPALVKHGDEVYQVDNAHDIEEYARLMLTTKEEAMHLPAGWANELFEEVHTEPRFHAAFLYNVELPRLQALAELQTVLAVYATTPQASIWHVFEALGDIDLYPAAVVAGAEVYNLQVLVEELVEFLTSQGEHFLNEMQGGIFESVDLNEGDDEGSDKGIFYIYTKDDVSWQVALKD
jgi:hypothetical protein